MAEEARQKYDLEMASYRQAGFAQQNDGASATTTSSVAVSQAGGVTYTTGNYAGLL